MGLSVTCTFSLATVGLIPFHVAAPRVCAKVVLWDRFHKERTIHTFGRRHATINIFRTIRHAQVRPAVCTTYPTSPVEMRWGISDPIHKALQGSELKSQLTANSYPPSAVENLQCSHMEE